MQRQELNRFKTPEIFRLPDLLYSERGYHLNWFGKAEDEGRTEEPTAHKLKKAKEKGDTPRSVELDAAIMILVCFSIIYFLSGYIYDSCAGVVRVFFLNEFNIKNVTEDEIYKIMEYCFIQVFKISGPVMLAAFICAIITGLSQVGFIFSTEKLKFDITKIKIDPQKLFEKSFFSKQVMFNFFKSIVKLLIIGLVAYSVLKNKMDVFIGLVQVQPFESVIFIAKTTFEIIVKCAIFLIIFSIIDYKYQKREYIEKLKMTKQEVKDEFKQMEGDPQIKSKIREKQRDAVRRRMMQEVPNADVVVRNPTHYAVAIKYEAKEMSAPVVIAKGTGFIALKIIEIAEENRVPIVTNKPLARTLYSQVELGDPVPVELYKTVAEILAYVWKLKGKTL
ncbi:MAG TPA: flagellar biosynthesis protein FlhB [bacterium]|nr:flagellar biosynthesis protein FlhB [bacterium]HPN31140.1 flagellar biosynthesis protein FlhB [bacterium]